MNTTNGHALSASEQQQELQHKLSILRSRNRLALTHDEALQLAIEASELSIEFTRVAKSKAEKAERRVVADRLLTQAERIRSTEEWSPGAATNLIDLDLLGSDNPASQPLAPGSLPLRSRTSTPSSSKQEQRTIAAADGGNSAQGSGNSRRSPEDVDAPQACREIPRDEQIIKYRASLLRGGPYPPWSDAQIQSLSASMFSGSTLFEDKTSFRISADQEALLDDWKRPFDAIPPPFSRSRAGTLMDDSPGPTMTTQSPIDLVQDAASDCSVVASMCAGLSRVEKGHSSLLPQLFFPFDKSNACPIISTTGKYIMRLNFNGCFRKVIVDDRLPVSKSPRLLHVIDRNNPALLWPALLEKAYLKIRGGYDFPGSNSGTDLWILTGWIPEQVFLTHDDVDIEQVWERIRTGFSYGDVLITAGTGEITPKTERALGLAGFHDYAVLDLKEEHGQRLVLIKNPWVNGTTWKGQAGEAGLRLAFSPENDSDCSDEGDFKSALDPSETRSDDNVDLSVERPAIERPGTFWMPIRDIVQNFSTLYLNWNPRLFKYQCEMHFVWHLDTDRGPFRSFRSNPQVAVSCEMDDQVWLILEKHYTDRHLEAVESPDEYIALFAFRSNGHRVTLNRGAAASLHFIDSPQTLLKVGMEANIPVTIVPHEQRLASAPYTFTLRAFSLHPLQMSWAKRDFADIVSVNGAWTMDNSGGNASSVLYTKNPQFVLHLPSQSRVAVLLETLDESLSVHVKLLHSRGKRKTHVMKQDIITDSGNHSKGCAYAELRRGNLLDAGDYTIICNTFDPNCTAPFKLHVESDVSASLNPMQREGAGRLRQRLTEATFGTDVRKITTPFVPHRHTLVNFTIQIARPALTAMGDSSPVRLTVEYGIGPERQILLSSGSGAFREAATELHTDDCVLQPLEKAVAHGHNLWLTLERMAGAQGALEETFQVTAWPNAMDWAAFGVWRDAEV